MSLFSFQSAKQAPEAGLHLHALPLHVSDAEYATMHDIVVAIKQRRAAIGWVVVAIIWESVE